MSRAAVVAVLLLVALPASSTAQVSRDLKEAMQARLDAVWKKDAAAWARLTADEFTVVVPEGVLMTKAERLAALKTETPELAHAVQREQIQEVGDVVVRRFLDGNEWVLEIWARKDGVWRVISAQVNFAKR